MKRGLPTIIPAALLIIFTFLPTGCGRKTPPVPPATVMPKIITDLHHQLDEQGVTLIWTAPARTVQGDKLDRIDGFELLRAVVAEDDYCEGCPIKFGRPIKIEPGATVPGGKVHYHETVLRPGYHYLYQVRTKLGWYHASNGSNIVSFAWNTLISPPKNLTAVAGDNKVVLSWQAPSTLIDGSKITTPLSYQIFRSVAGSALSPLGAAVGTTTFTDVLVQNGTRYFYKVQPLSKKSVGIMSKTAQARPHDLTAPAPPQKITAVQTSAGIKVLWQQTPDTDLAGYRIYRRREKEKKTSLVGEVTGGMLMFLDTTQITPGTWYYTVKAYDNADPANESKPSSEAKLLISK